MAVTGSLMTYGLLSGAFSYVTQQRQQKQAEDQAEQMKKDREKQFADEQALIAQQKQKQDELQQQQDLTRYGDENKLLAQSRQRKLAAQGQSYRDTVLTSPLGLPGTGATQPLAPQKTLLGA